MPKENKKKIPYEMAMSLMEWAFQKMHYMDEIDIRPCLVARSDADNNKYVVEATPMDAELWTVYGHYRERRRMDVIEPLGHYDTEAEAMALQEMLLNAYPHLNDPKRRETRQQWSAMENKLCLPAPSP